jgi:four helix bundle protein
MSFKFEKLIIWQLAMDFAEEINLLSESFPKREVYNLSSQIQRAADSIALNISEGSIEQSTPEFKRFLNYSLRSIAEVVTCLHKAKRRNYIMQHQFDELYAKSFELMNRTLAFKAQLK